MSLAIAIDHFLSHLRIERAMAENTVLAYGRDLSALHAFLLDSPRKDDPRLTEVDATTIRKYLQHLHESGVRSRTLARKLSCLRSFYRFLLEEDLVTSDPTETIRSPKLGRPLPYSAGPEELLRFLSTPDTTTLRGLRDRALLSMMYAAGLRVSEVASLCLGDVDRRKGSVTTVGKGEKRRIVPIGTLTLDHLTEYLDARESHPAQSTSVVLFSGPKGRALTRQGIWRIVKSYSYAAGLPVDLHPHSLRHAFASHLLSGGADLRSVQLLLGHASIVTTEIYTHISASHVRAAHQAAHPRGS